MALGKDASRVLFNMYPDVEEEYRQRGWVMFPRIDRVYVNTKARNELGWEPQHTFYRVFERWKAGGAVLSSLAHSIGCKGYHPTSFDNEPYPVEG